jgi:hypothetical protein
MIAVIHNAKGKMPTQHTCAFSMGILHRAFALHLREYRHARQRLTPEELQ